MTSPATLTFLFTDLVGSTDLLGRLGDDAAVAVHRRVDDLLRATLGEHRGTEVKSLGDGLMVVFPSAVDAVAGALDMQQRIAASDLDVAIRIGINSGEAIAAGDDFHGTPVVTAQRLCDLADGGQVLISGVTRALVGSKGGFGFVALGQRRLKGIPGAVEVWTIGDAAQDREAGSVSVSYPTVINGPAGGRLVGRDDVLARLDAAWDEARTGVRRLAFIAGEPGIGKTASAAVWTRSAFDKGAAVLAGRCASEAVIPYQPFVEILHQLLADPGAAAVVAHLGPRAAELGRLVPDLQGLLPARAAVQAEPGTERYLLYEAVVSALYAVAEEVPLVVVFDDLHWADAPTVALLDHLARHPRQGRLLVIGTYREIDLGRSHPLAASLVELRRERGFDRIQLRGLDQASVARLLADAAGDDVPDSFSKAVWNETEGNPFFVEEVVTHLLESRLIGPGMPWPEAADLYRLGIPEGIREVVGRRLSRLSEATNRTLAAASVIGREFEIDLLEDLREVDDDSVVDQVDEAMAARILTEAPSSPGRYMFTHALIRQTLYEELNPTRRARLHRRVAEALSAGGGSAAELALHFIAAHQPDRALAASISAAAAAEDVVALAEARRHYRQALELWDEVDDPETVCGIDRPELLRRAAEAAHLIDGGIGEAIDLALEAERLIDASAEPVRAGTIAERLGRYMWLGGRGQEAIDAGERAVALIPAEPATPERARALATLAGVLMLFGRHGEATERCLQAIDVARQVQDRTVEANVLVTLGSIEGLTKRLDDSLLHLRQGRQLAFEQGAVDDVLRSYANLASILDIAGRLEEAVTDALAGAEEAARLGLYGRYFWFHRGNAAWSLFRLGRWDEAAALLDLDREIHADGVAEIHLQTMRTFLTLHTGDFVATRRQLGLLEDLSAGTIDPQLVGPIYWLAAYLERFDGDLSRAWTLAEEGVDRTQKGEDWFNRAPLHVLGTAVAVELALGDRRSRGAEDARVLVRQMEGAAEEAEGADFPAQLAQARAELTRLDEADPDAWSKAADLWEAFPQPYDAAYCRFRQGEALIAIGRKDEGGLLLDQAAEVTDRLRAAPLRRMIDAVRSP